MTNSLCLTLGGFALIVVLFILLIIVGTAFVGGCGFV
ncbi:YjcZ family sporulation protein [Bacillus salipaludis]|nr:YjcZ family sporulation protein [Bacillus salipaludis]